MRRMTRAGVPGIVIVLTCLICAISGCSQKEELSTRVAYEGLGFCLPADWKLDDYDTDSWASYSPHDEDGETEEADGGIMVTFSPEADGSLPWTMGDHFEDDTFVYDRIDEREIDGDKCWTYEVSFVDDEDSPATYETYYWGDGFYYDIFFTSIPFDPIDFVDTIELL